MKDSRKTRLISIVSKPIIIVVVVVVIDVVFVTKKVRSKKILVKKNSCPKNFRLKKFWVKKKKVQKIFGKKRMLCPKFFLCPNKFGSKKNVQPPKKIKSEKNEFWPQKDLGFLSLGSLIVEFGGVLVVILVVLVTWVLRT